MNDTIHNIILNIKRELRLAMNGDVSTLQRKLGLNYHVIFGVELPRIKEIASHYKKNKELAAELWKQNIRECKIMAVLLMPVDEFTNDEAKEWINATLYTEIGDILGMYLLCKMPDAVVNALSWIQHENMMFVYCGFITLSHIFKNNERLSSDEEELFIRTVEAIIPDEQKNNVTRTYAHRALTQYMRLLTPMERAKIEARSTLNLFFF